MTLCLNVRPDDPPRKPRPSSQPGKLSQASGCRPFAALPHDLRKDPALRGHDKAILLAAALLEYARDKPSCWPSNRRLAEDLGCSTRTVQLALAALRDSGWIRAEQGGEGRRIFLVWREADCAPSPKPVALDRAQAIAPELKKEGEAKRPGSGGSTHPGGGEGETPTADELAQLEAWARGSDPLLARFGRAGLAAAGMIGGVIVDTPAPGPGQGHRPSAGQE